jgi:transcriptional regulator with XRE-family HTH domain
VSSFRICNLELYRRGLRLSQDALGRRAGVPQHRISLFERGLRPHADELRALASFFGLSEQDAPRLLEEAPPNVIPPAPLVADRLRESEMRAADAAALPRRRRK